MASHILLDLAYITRICYDFLEVNLAIFKNKI